MSLPPLGTASGPSFREEALGTYGEFVTKGGRVAYLMTNAKLSGAGEIDPQRRLTTMLRPVREVLDPRAMSFAQLLQRDLDDDRVANELVPYLLRLSGSGPAFLPPLLAVLLPFRDDNALATFEAGVIAQELVTDTGATYEREAFGDAFAVDRLA